MQIYPTNTLTEAELQILRQAEEILLSRLRRPGALLDSPGAIALLLRLRMGAEDREVCDAIYLDGACRVIDVERIAYGDRDECEVSIPQLCRRALLQNASSVVVAHCHPASQCPDPSPADVAFTCELREALKVLGIRLVDHVIVTASEAFSMQEQGLIA